MFDVRMATITTSATTLRWLFAILLSVHLGGGFTTGTLASNETASTLSNNTDTDSISSTAATTTTIATTTVATTTTTTTTTTILVCPSFEPPANAQTVGGHSCTDTHDGAHCTAECKEGYTTSLALEFVCSQEEWIQVDGLFVNDNTCEDYDACHSNGCNLLTSECVDDEPPSMSYTCTCLPGFSGDPGSDGSGCARTSVLTSNGDIILRTGAQRDIEFNIGHISFTATELRNSIEEEKLRAQEAENTLDEALNEIASGLASDLAEAEERGHTALEEAEISLVEDIVMTKSTLESELVAATGSMESKINSVINSASEMEEALLGELSEAREDVTDALNTKTSYLEIKIAQVESNTQSFFQSELQDLEAQLESGIEALASHLSAEVTTAVQEKKVIRENVNSLESLITTLADAHDELSGAHKDVKAFTDTLEQHLNTEAARAKSAENNLQNAVESVQLVAASAHSKFTYYFTKTQVENMINNLRSEMQSWTSSNFYTQSASNNRYYTKTHINNNFFTKLQTSSAFLTSNSANSIYATKSTLSSEYYTRLQVDSTFNTLYSRMAYPIQANTQRRLPLIATNWVSMNSIPSNARAQFLHMPPGWRLYSIAPYASFTRLHLSVHVRPPNYMGGSVTTICSSTTINRDIICHHGSFSAPTRLYVAQLSRVLSFDVFYGGEYRIIKV